VSRHHGLHGFWSSFLIERCRVITRAMSRRRLKERSRSFVASSGLGFRRKRKAAGTLIVALLDPMKPAPARYNLVDCRSQQRARVQLTGRSLRALVFAM
jgi:hypothetical protein